VSDYANEVKTYYVYYVEGLEATASRRKELLRRVDEWLQREPDCPFCGLMTWDDDAKRWIHNSGCELEKELEDE